MLPFDASFNVNNKSGDSKKLPRFPVIFSEPCSTANSITYLYFCTLGGLTNPRCATMTNHGYTTYHLLSY